MKSLSGICPLLAACLLASCARPESGSARAFAAADSPSGKGLGIASLNLAMEKDAQRILADLNKAPEVRNADVLFLQEAVHSEAAHDGVAGEVARALNMRVVFAPAGPGVYDRGLAILSRYPIRDVHVRHLKVFNLRFHNRSRFALAATIDAPDGPVRVWNVHLDTRINPDQRLEQLAPVLEDAAAHDGPKIIGGDLNTNDFYWVLNVLPIPRPGLQTGAVRRFMAAHGFATPIQGDPATFNSLGMHLDWIYEKGLQARGFSIHEMPFSDHRALAVRFSPAASTSESRLSAPALR